MRRAAILILPAMLGLSGCYPDQKSDVFECEAQASRFFQTYRAVAVDAPSSQYIIQCMAAKDYDFTIAPPDCDSKHPLPVQPACYVPRNWLAAMYDRMRRPLRRD